MFGHESEVRSSATGRVNLLGEHTDYNGGFVLPTAIPQRTYIELAGRNDRVVRAWSSNVGGFTMEYTLGSEKRLGHWIDYIQGLTSVLAETGYSLKGCDIRIESQIPVGSGLSSSAALGVSLLQAIAMAFALDIDPLHAVKLVQRSENDFVGVPVGILDPMACSFGKEHMALFIDTETLQYRHIPIPRSVELLVIHSGISHSHTDGQYGVRREECKHAAALLGVNQLRDLQNSPGLPDRAIGTLPEPYGRRVRHVITENNRVLLAVEALTNKDVQTLGKLFYDSHKSLRDDYEVSVPELDLLVELACLEPDILGARMTGGGFGGSVVMLARPRTALDTGSRIAAAYQEQSGRTPALLVPRHLPSTQAAGLRTC